MMITSMNKQPGEGAHVRLVRALRAKLQLENLTSILEALGSISSVCGLQA